MTPTRHQTNVHSSTRPDWSDATVSSAALRILRRHPDRIAFSADTGCLTYAGSLQLIGSLQHALAARGLRRGDRVGVLAGNSAQAWCAGVAVQASAMALSPLHPMGSLEDHLHQLSDLDAAACIVDAGAFSERASELAASGMATLMLGPNDIGPDLLAEAATFGAIAARNAASADDIAVVNYTGGSTGRPKGVVRRHSGVLYAAISVMANLEIPYKANYLASAPISHVAGSKVLPVLSRGGSVYLHDGFDPGRMLHAIERDRITMSLVVPTMVYALLDHPHLSTTDLSSLRVLHYGAAPMSPTRIEEGIERMGPIFAQLYGQSECYPIAVLRRDEHCDPRLVGSCGSPVDGTEVALLDPDGEPVALGEPGEICVRGPAVMEHYWQRPDLDAEAFAHGWLHSGDIARADDRGYLTIVDRIKDMIITGGFNVYPREVEDAISSHHAVATAAVFGVPDDKWGEAVTAAIVLRDGVETTAEELSSHVRQLKGAVQTPKHISFFDTLPQTTVGKVDKKALRRNWSRPDQ